VSDGCSLVSLHTNRNEINHATFLLDLQLKLQGKTLASEYSLRKTDDPNMFAGEEMKRNGMN
jgi:hypothetical protein